MLPRPRCISIFCCLVTVAGLSVPAVTHGAEVITDSKTELLQQQKKIRRLQEGIEEHTQRITVTKKSERNILTELGAIDKRQAEEQHQLDELNKQLAAREEAIRAKEAEVAAAQEEKELRQQPAEQRLAAYYRMGDIGVLNLLFSASSLPELLKFKEYFHRILQHDREVIDQYRQTIAQLAKANDELKTEKDRLLTVIADITYQKQRLNDTRTERLALLDRVKTEKKLYQRAVEEMQDAAKELTATIEKLKQKAAAKAKAQKSERLESPKKKRPAAAKGFPALRGRLSPPVTGTVVTSFGRSTSKKFGISTFSNGIDIQTDPGAEVHAVYDGTVAFAGVLRGYGNLVIIDHGGQYFTLMSRIATLNTEEGLQVKGGDVVGTMGTAEDGLITEGLHFEIRYGTKPQNPLLWLQKGKLNLAPSDDKAP